MKTLLFILFFASLSSCRNSRDFLYGKCKKGFYACTQILLKENGEFEYFQFYDVGGSQLVTGRWQSLSDTVVLNTYEQQESRLDTVIESKAANGKIRMEFEGPFWGHVSVDSMRYNLSNGQKILEFNEPIKAVTFNFYDDQGNTIPVYYRIKNSSTNYILVKVRRLTTDFILKDRKYIRTRGKLKFIGQTGEYKLTTMKNKQWTVR
jgi:hypothetical protein